ncbi:unnamed protein product [Arabis nemorensis]|uniref:Uncharacterized protein n=1 Tax=Arabis nemorensis TaxID=586526 RepID=A0A565BXC1_9BRAS|nr:unnamed protein product [Arabis nemorensis]
MARRRLEEELRLLQRVLERKSASGQNVDVNDLALIYAYAVKESLANVYGHKLGSFATSFERSFNTTLRTLVEINDSACPDNLSKSEDVSKGDEELKTDLEDITKACMFTLIKDLFTAGVFNVLAWTWYGALRLLRKENHGRFWWLDDHPRHVPDMPTFIAYKEENAVTFYGSLPRYCLRFIG